MFVLNNILCIFYSHQARLECSGSFSSSVKKELEAHYKEMIWFENSGHGPLEEEPENIFCLHTAKNFFNQPYSG